MSATPPLDIVIVSYRCEALLRSSLASIEAHAPAGTVVHVVDNASGDGTAEMVRREFPAVRLRVCDRNIGFGAANNLALEECEAPYVLILNPDTRLPPGALDSLLELMEARAEVGMCGPRLELEDSTFDHASRRSFPTPLSALGHFSGLGRRAAAGGALAAYRAPAVERGPVEAVNGAFMLIRRAALDQVGPFDERYWMYMEDLDLCYRFAERGWVTWYEPGVAVLHVKAGTTGPTRTARLHSAFHYGMFRFYRDHYAPGRNRALNAAVYLGILAKWAIGLLGRGLAATRRTRPGASAQG